MPGGVEVGAFIASVEPPGRQAEAHMLDGMFRDVTGQVPAMWGKSILGYGQYDTVYTSGRAVRSFRVGFSPRKARQVLYLMESGAGAEPPFAPLLARLGHHSQGQACLYVSRLEAVDRVVLAELVGVAWQQSLARYPG